MKNEEFAQLVRSIEAGSSKDPAAFRRAALAWAAGGYGFVLGTLAIIGVALGLCVWYLSHQRGGAAAVVKLMIAIGAVGVAIVRALWVRFEAPEGLRLEEANAPALRNEVESLRQALETPPIHQILITSELNASLTQTPRLGPLGFYRNTLSIGLPLMDALPVEEFRAVLAHEMGHASRAHGRAGAWIYRLRLTFARLQEHFKESKGLFEGFFQRFFDWWWPRFVAHAMVSGRIREFEADAYARERESGVALIRALARIRSVGAHLDAAFWPSIQALNRNHRNPPQDLLDRMHAALRAAAPEVRILQEAWLEESSIEDSHPSLRQRAEALGVGRDEMQSIGPVHECASSLYLGEARRRLAEALSAEWRTSIEPMWGVGQTESHEQAERASELDARADALSADDIIERALLANSLEGQGAALRWFDRALALEPDHAAALFHSGRLRLEQGDEAGAAALRKAANTEPFRGAALSLMAAHLRKSGRTAEIAEVEKELWAYGDLVAAAEKEREAISAADEFEAHGLDEALVEQWRALVRPHPDIEAAYLCRKRMKHLTHDARLVLAVKVRVPWYRRSEPVTNRVLESLVKNFPGAGWAVILNNAEKKLRTKVEAASTRIV